MIVFYEKTGCKTNTRQKALLTEAGYCVEARDLRDQDWLPSDLHNYLKDFPVKDWFNKAAPDVKSGAVKPDTLTEYEAISLLVKTPLLIRRPLIETDLGVGCGFEQATLQKLGISNIDFDLGKEGCSNAHPHTCADPKRDMP